MSVPAFLVDQLYLIVVGVFAVASIGILGWSRRRNGPSSGTPGLAGLRTAAIAGVLPVVVLALLLVVVAITLGGLIRGLAGSGYPAPTPPPVDPAIRLRDNLIGFLWFLSIPGVAFLAVLDLYAIRPPHPEDSGAAKRYAVRGTAFSLFLLGSTILASTMINDAVDAAARRDAEEVASAKRDADALAREARSAGLSIVVTVVDAEHGERTDDGRLLSRLTLDVTLRSATDIELSPTRGGAQAARLSLYNHDVYYGELTQGMSLPARLPAGFETTYRLNVPMEWSCRQSGHVFVAVPCDTAAELAAGLRDPNPAVTGAWDATLVFSNDVPYDDPRRLNYDTATDFTVADVP